MSGSGNWKWLLMRRLPLISGRDMVRLLQSLGFSVTRTRGSHVRMRDDDGRVTTVPVHGNRPLPKGLLRKIIREDLEMSLEEFSDAWSRFR